MNTNEAIEVIKNFDEKEKEAARLTLAILAHRTGGHKGNISAAAGLIPKFIDKVEYGKAREAAVAITTSYNKMMEIILEMEGYVNGD